ncbi:MAG: TRAP transporter small permease [candidate division WOR-3 bacterium]
MLGIVASVLLRTLRIGYIAGIEELVQYLMVVCIYVGIVPVQIHRRHLRVKFLIDRYGPKVKILVELLAWVIFFFLFCLISYDAVRGLIASMKNLDRLVGIPFPTYPFRLGMTVGCFSMCFVLLGDIWDSITRLLAAKEKITVS